MRLPTSSMCRVFSFSTSDISIEAAASDEVTSTPSTKIRRGTRVTSSGPLSSISVSIRSGRQRPLRNNSPRTSWPSLRVFILRLRTAARDAARSWLSRVARVASLTNISPAWIRATIAVGSSSDKGAPGRVGSMRISMRWMKKPMSSCRRKSVSAIHSRELADPEPRAPTLASSVRGGTALIRLSGWRPSHR